MLLKQGLSSRHGLRNKDRVVSRKGRTAGPCLGQLFLTLKTATGSWIRRISVTCYIKVIQNVGLFLHNFGRHSQTLAITGWILSYLASYLPCCLWKSCPDVHILRLVFLRFCLYFWFPFPLVFIHLALSFLDFLYTWIHVSH